MPDAVFVWRHSKPPSPCLSVVHPKAAELRPFLALPAASEGAARSGGVAAGEGIAAPGGSAFLPTVAGGSSDGGGVYFWGAFTTRCYSGRLRRGASQRGTSAAAAASGPAITDAIAVIQLETERAVRETAAGRRQFADALSGALLEFAARRCLERRYC